MYRDTISVIGFKCFNSLHLVHISDLHQEESLLVVSEWKQNHCRGSYQRDIHHFFCNRFRSRYIVKVQTRRDHLLYDRQKHSNNC